jgi:hypothetical protein
MWSAAGYGMENLYALGMKGRSSTILEATKYIEETVKLLSWFLLRRFFTWKKRYIQKQKGTV